MIPAADGAAALLLAAREQPDLLLLDLKLPHADGWEVLAQIRRFSDLPVLVLTGLNQPDDRIRSFELGADDYLAALLLTLAREPGRVFTRQELWEALWGEPVAFDPRTIHTHVKRLRERLEGGRHRYIHTVWGVGYRFEVRERSDPHRPSD